MRSMVQLGVVVLGMLAMTMSGVASQGIQLEALEINRVEPDAQVLQVGRAVGMTSSLSHIHPHAQCESRWAPQNRVR